MRIGINAAFLDSNFSGLSIYTQAVVDQLSHSGHEIYAYTSECRRLHESDHTKFRGTPVLLRAENGTTGNALRALAWTQTALPFRLLRDQIQVLLNPVPEGMLAPVCPQVVVVHDLFPLFFPDLYPRWRLYFQRVLPRVLKASRCVITVSEHTRRDLVQHLKVPGDKIRVVYNWVDSLYFSDAAGEPPEEITNAPYFLFVGRSTGYKNLEMVIRAFAAIQNDVEHRLVCVLGFSSDLDREYFSIMLGLASSLGVRDRLQIYTGVSPKRLLYLYRHATALVLLSKYEGFGYPPLEAMAVGTPAIVSNSTSLSEVTGPGAVSVPNSEPFSAAEAMKKLACDSAFRIEMSDRGRARAKQFTADKGAALITSIIEQCATSA